MKKTTALVMVALFLAGPVLAISPEEARKAHREEMKKIKRAEREAKAAGQVPDQETFWDREWKRSGFSDRFSGDKTKSFFKNMNPVPFFKAQSQKYEERKSSAGAN